MKNVFRLLIIAALATVFALPAFAQGTQATAAQCTADTDAKAGLYQKFLGSYKGNPDQQKVAYDTGKEYLGKYGNCPDEADKKIAQFIQNWIGKYEAAKSDFDFTNAIANDPARAFQMSRDILAKNPDNLKVYLQLVAAGANSAKNGEGLFPDAANAARKALDLINAGKTTDNWIIANNQQDAVAGLNYYIGVFTLKNAPGDAAAALLKAAQSNGKFSKEPSTYQSLGLAYYNNEFKKLAQDYKDKCEGKEATPECDALFARVNQVLDRVIDAYARAVALNASNTQLKTLLATLYKQRHPEPEANLDAYISKVLSTPLPIPGQEPAPTPTPSNSSGTTGTDGNGTATTGTTAKPATNLGTKPATTPANNNQTKPASTTPPKPPVSKATPAAKSGAAASGH